MGELLANVGMRWEQRRRQCDGKQSGTGQTIGGEQENVWRDGTRREQKPTTGQVGARGQERNITWFPVPFPSQPHFHVPSRPLPRVPLLFYGHIVSNTWYRISNTFFVRYPPLLITDTGTYYRTCKHLLTSVGYDIRWLKMPRLIYGNEDSPDTRSPARAVPPGTICIIPRDGSPGRVVLCVVRQRF